jgi:hypothetical protein
MTKPTGSCVPGAASSAERDCRIANATRNEWPTVGGRSPARTCRQLDDLSRGRAAFEAQQGILIRLPSLHSACVQSGSVLMASALSRQIRLWITQMELRKSRRVVFERGYDAHMWLSTAPGAELARSRISRTPGSKEICVAPLGTLNEMTQPPISDRAIAEEIGVGTMTVSQDTQEGSCAIGTVKRAAVRTARRCQRHPTVPMTSTKTMASRQAAELRSGL